MECVVCAIAKNEHLYINDFCHWYLKIGFDHIYIYDNDDKTSPYIGDFIDFEIRDKVTIIDIRGKHYRKIQIKKYNKFYKKYHKKFDWAFFPDIDEFLTGITDIKAFLAQPKFNDIHSIRIKWRLIGDDDQITRDMSKPLYDTLFTPVDTWENNPRYNKLEILSLKNQGKYLVRGKLKFKPKIISEHFVGRSGVDPKINCVLPSGFPCKSEIIINEPYENEKIFLNHYMTKTLSEFFRQKMGRTDAIFENYKLNLGYYWRINKITKEKIDWLWDHRYITEVELNWYYGELVKHDTTM